MSHTQQHIVKADVFYIKSQLPATAGAALGQLEHKPACRLCRAPWPAAVPSLTACCAHARSQVLTVHKSDAEACGRLLLCQVEL